MPTFEFTPRPMKAHELYTMTLGQQFLPAIVNRDLSNLSASEEAQAEQEHHDNRVMAEEQFGNRVVAVIYEVIGEESHFAKCEWTRLGSDCFDVKVIAMVSGGKRGLVNPDGTIEYFDGEY